MIMLKDSNTSFNHACKTDKVKEINIKNENPYSGGKGKTNIKIILEEIKSDLKKSSKIKKSG